MLCTYSWWELRYKLKPHHLNNKHITIDAVASIQLHGLSKCIYKYIYTLASITSEYKANSQQSSLWWPSEGC